MKQLTLIVGGIYGMLAIILGAFGAHLFKQYLSPEKLVSFETGVRYQMYHAIFLVVIGLFLSFNTTLERWTAICIMVGTLLFSLSIYLLAFSEYWKVDLRFLGPVTPIGGMVMIVGWALLIVLFCKHKF